MPIFWKIVPTSDNGGIVNAKCEVFFTIVV